MGSGLLIDTTKCIGCGACVYACREQNGLPHNDDDKLTDKSYTVLEKTGDSYVRKLCMHCDKPSCVSVCPIGAFEKTQEGAVVYDGGKCMGCRYCIYACPFNVPKYEWDRAIPVVRKCIMCIDRIRGGKPTACAEACPEGATLFGKRDELLKTAKERISANPEDYYNYIYGEHEAGGTSVFFLAKNDFRTMGFNMDIFREPYENFTWWIMSRIPSFVLVWGAFLAGIWWLTNRKNRIAEELSEKDKEDK